jgi:two-component system response regulator YesN
MLKEIKIHNEILGEARDGEEMIELIKIYTPDVAFVDIKMPKLNGLEAIKIAKTFSPDTKWVILTSYSEFNYAKEAISLGAYEYLLKPVKPEKLEQTLSEILQIEKKNIIISNESFENKINSLFYNTRSFDDEKENVFRKSNYIGANFIFDSFLNEKQKADLQTKFCSSLRNCIKESITKKIKIALITMPNGTLSIIFSWDKKNDNLNEKEIKTSCKKIIDISKNKNNNNFSITMLKTEKCLSFLNLSQQLNELEQLSILRIIIGIGSTISFNEIKKIANNLDLNLKNLLNLFNELSDAYREKSYLNFMKKIEILEKDISQLDINNHTKTNILYFLKYAINFDINLKNSNEKIIESLKNNANKLLNVDSIDKDSTNIISRVNKYIDENYSLDIGIAQIAYKLNLTPNYLSYLFHKQKGTTFVKYLKKIRILKAKELLMQSNLKINDVAKKVGYYNPQYFSKLFKKECGCYPSDYYKLNKK